MKTITVKQPWASLIVDGAKDVENRSWPTKYRGRILIHASIKPDYDIINTANPSIYNAIKIKDYLFKDDIDAYCAVGAIIGSVEIVDCVINHPSIWAEKTLISAPKINWLENKELSPVYNWVLVNPIKFPEPIPAKGKLSFWDYPNILAEPEEKDGELFCHCQLSVKEENQVSGDSRFGYFCRYCGGKWYK